MKIYPDKKVSERKRGFNELTPMQQKIRQAALLLALVSVFIWFFKILFF
ncbi:MULTISPECIES: hypothetical protein [Dyadobacter]|uniref:Uncharacterized protein n=2 Tax=Dyadobacter TaxID=120831 RepID=A0A2P8G864_9BACT|nr:MULTISPECIES: hypothetical protein [Dyadobacter]MBZ1359802.1 hypothetical protein [Dyadobacter fermentans]MDR6806142.1 hypothetical protein [Dyadobacter fermentans]MDR7043883.1 hypothetical protein [Dyadobacter sp. BE242]MDR7198194.1 hypothetical protein [Dyadobacter sp. BE34]MDR7216157.1 hypothetical protein [Dyadobacter sp. BE31]